MASLSLMRRLANLERARRANGDGLMTIIVEGGMPDANPFDLATSGESSWTRFDGESAEEFRSRSEAVCRTSGAKFLTFGGLPHR